ncbi:uncharacterized protein [Blastocystis hominis]|uniref:Importin N-terminal domain-containing protein n=1 Tax=Blastocystis hominis TaxID=12968 RepID=D8M7P1_BLAHO|nr:uncharacterized protein [Blastocystis hominis]CBK24080.2 unnamed protein product [Blastocystis hominis]|eukprot:XP_012898128.1 uncharacterized protein [Blastocystis hominis]
MDTNVRIIAGFTLKSSLKGCYYQSSEEDKAYIRSCVLQALLDPIQPIRNAAGVIATQLVTVGSLKAWPDLLPTLMKMLKSENTECIVTALSCLSKITEDNIYELDSAEVNYPLNDLIPLFISFFQHPSQEVVYHNVSCMRNSIDAMPNALLVNMDAYLQALSWLLTRTNDETLALICNSLVSILSLRVDALLPSLDGVFEFMLQMSQHPNHFVATQATEFWSTFATLQEQDDVLQRLSGYLPRLIPMLVLVRVVCGGEWGVEYAVQRRRTGFAERGRVGCVRRGRRASVRVPAREGRQVEFSREKMKRRSLALDEDQGMWTLRKASAWALDCLSNAYNADVLEIIAPVLSVREKTRREA